MEWIRGKYVDLPRVSNLSLEEFRRTFHALEQPVILVNFANVADWPVFRDWTLERLEQQYGDLTLNPRINYPDPDQLDINPFVLTYEEFPPRKQMLLKEYIERLKDPSLMTNPIYWRTIGPEREVMNSMRDFIAGVRFADIIPEDAADSDASMSDMNLLIGSKGVRAGFHQDDRHNFLVHVIGRKAVYLGSPYYTSCFYPFPGIPDKSQVAPEQLDDPRFPLLKEAIIYRGVIGPGEVLFIPRGWWHALRGLEPTVMFNRWHGEPLTAADFKFMYRSLGYKYRLSVGVAFVRIFLKTTSNILRRKHPLSGLSVWYTPGTQTAVNLFNSLKRARHWLLKNALRRQNVEEAQLIERPFLYN